MDTERIIVYGSRTCPHCMMFIRMLDEDGISYTFKEVDHDDEHFSEMYEKIKSINFKGYVNYPVVDLEGRILVAPDYDDFNRLYREGLSSGDRTTREH